MDNERLKWNTVIINGKKVKVFEESYLFGAMWIQDGYCMILYYYNYEEVEVLEDLIESIK